MPILTSTYNPPWIFKNRHISTIYSAKFRPIPKLIQQRERVHLSDGDFLDIDWSFSETPTNKVAILLHGLEGNAQRTYIKSSGKLLIENQWDVAAVNYRGCSGELNESFQTYNAGKTDDLEAVINFILEKNTYDEIVLLGFSLGGNLLLKYLGERDILPKQVKKGISISSPLSLKGSLIALQKPENWVYRTSFLLDMRKKYKTKMAKFPDKMNKETLKKIKSLLDFDNLYTAPAHGFKDADDYYANNSCLQFLPNIKVPVYLLNAKNDSFLSSDCYPTGLAKNSKTLFLETPKYGGHVGYHLNNSIYYSEKRTLEFLNDSFT
ncbi:MAG: putative alpha/beta-fold hydrolase [Flavobacteriaceae bacterium]|jgi:predicted alpha/beta-fold hydrolase|uniref:YheT family hydrolase n=1 Tax=Candidatus Marifrigoribacter sp. Uisw_064 TaxID=3230970 RepID=UPI003AE323BB